MFDSSHLLVILIVALILIGPKHLPDIMRIVGKLIGDVRRMSTDVRNTLEREIERADEIKRIEETQKELFGDQSANTTAPAAAEAPQEQKPAAASEPAPAAAQAAATPNAGEVPPAQPAEANAAPSAAPVQDKSHA